MSQPSHAIGGMVACESMTLPGEREFNEADRDVLSLTLFPVNLAQDGGEVQVRAGWGVVGVRAKISRCYVTCSFSVTHHMTVKEGRRVISYIYLYIYIFIYRYIYI